MFEKIPEIISIGVAAKLLNVNIATLRRWDEKGLLKAFRPTVLNKRRYKKVDIIAYIQSNPSRLKK